MLRRYISISLIFFYLFSGLSWADSVTINTSDGPVVFQVELADTPKLRGQGLMNRHELARDAGMLFVNKEERKISMWMKNTFIPLDMLFINEFGIIMHIHENAVPHSTDTISSKEPAKNVLEINGGLARQLNIRIGDKVLYDLDE